MMKNFILTSESVTQGHPDKLCDQISDAIVDAYLKEDPLASLDAESVVAKGVLFLAARFAAEASIDIPEVARSVIEEVGYTEGEFNARDCTIMTSLTPLPPNPGLRRDEHGLTDEALEAITAKHQATVFGYACDQTPGMLPLPIWLAHRLARRLSTVRSADGLSYLAPDAQSQVAVEFHDRRPARVHSVTLVASQIEQDAVSPDRLHADLMAQVIEPVFADEALRPDGATRVFVNPEGPVIGGGPVLHSGLTGRKNAIDTYGGYSRQSGAALSGKDPLRVDRIGAYAARYAARNVVAAGLAGECEVQISYTIGLSRPVSVEVDTFGTGRLSDEEITKRLKAHFDFRPGAIVRAFNLRHLPRETDGGFYRRLAAYGHVGRVDIGLPWEETDLAEALG
jgi:S-adenosylmethionine synthetase